MDINDRDASYEKQGKTFISLQEGWKLMASGKKKLLTEGKDAFAKQKELKKKQSVKELKEEVPMSVKKDEVIDPAAEVPPVSTATPEVPAVDPAAVPSVDPAAPAIPPVDPAVDPAAAAAVPAVDGAVGLVASPEKKLATQQFVQSALKGVTSGNANNADLVTEYGFFKADIADPANGQYVVLAYPAGMKLKDIAAIAEPVETPAALAAVSDVAAETPVAGEVPGATTEEPGEVEPGPEGSPEDKAEDADEPKEDEESLNESARDPISVGKKNWKAYIAGILNESVKVEELKEDVDKEISQIKEDLAEAKKAGDKDEVAALEKQLAKAESKKNVKTTKEVTGKQTEKALNDLKKNFKGEKEEKEDDKK